MLKFHCLNYLAQSFTMKQLCILLLNLQNKNLDYFLCVCFCRGSLEGKREQKSYKALLEDPMLRFSGLYQESCSDLYVTCQVFAEGKPLALPVRTSYKAFSTRWKWVHLSVVHLCIYARVTQWWAQAGNQTKWWEMLLSDM